MTPKEWKAKRDNDPRYAQMVEKYRNWGEDYATAYAFADYEYANLTLKD